MSQYNPLGSRIPNVPFEQPKSLFRFGEQSIWSSQFLASTANATNQTFRLFTTPLGLTQVSSVGTSLKLQLTSVPYPLLEPVVELSVLLLRMLRVQTLVT